VVPDAQSDLTMYLIAGGAGFLGKNLAERIIAKENIPVRIFDRREKVFFSPRCEYIKGDVVNKSDVESAVKGCDVIFNLVSILPSSRAGKKFYNINTEGTRNILEVALRNGVKKILHVSSSVVYGIPKVIPLTEESEVKPIGDYGRSKLLSEEICLEYIKKGLDITILRSRFIIGPGRLGILTILFDWINKGKNIYLIGKGENRFQMVSIFDLIEACLLAQENGESGIYNIGADNVPQVKELLGALVKHANTGSQVVPTNAPIAKFILYILDKTNLIPLVKEQYGIGDKDYIVDTSKAKRDLGWVPKYGHIEMMNSAYDWYVVHRNDVSREFLSDFPREGLLKVLKRFS